MFVYSKAQFQMLLDLEDLVVFESLLDLGAGDGKVTQKMSPFFRHVLTTEISPVMQWRLKQKNFHILDIDSWNTMENFPKDLTIESYNGKPQYDVVACLNLLDRCDKPMTLLSDIKMVLKPSTGRLVIALVFPLQQYVETTIGNVPSEMLDVSHSQVWEVQFSSLIENVFKPLGYDLLKWTVAPYLCEGDFSQSFYALKDVIMVFRTSS
ncbi:Methyltransferase-like protein 9 [Cichlidogyrus casuarinus]|uniref:Methyltransferase-like protein 9 n=1 Tax=Cichlidogyrus casuarinus TaxID=1844966 RepID=A0ABD2Q862_9PLAT